MEERRPAGRAIIDENGQVQLVPGDGSVKRSRRWENSPDGRAVAKFKRRAAMEKRRLQVERLKAGLPAEPPKRKPPTKEERLNQLYGSLEVLKDAIPDVEKGGRAYRIMTRSAKGIVEAIKALEAGQEPDCRSWTIEKQALR